jgi:hypothetical protein
MSDTTSTSPVQIPPRTTLYALEELGAYTGLVEGVSSYVMRLANEHSVSVGDLVAKVLAEIPNPLGGLMYPSNQARGVDGYMFRNGNYSVNGVTDRAAAWVSALEAATGRRDLRLLTLLPLRAVIHEQLFCRERRWCSLCLEQWRGNEKPVYEPLLWGINLASHCPIHGGKLSSTCHHCGHSLLPLGALSVPGHCHYCGGWLGKLSINMREAGGKSDPVRAAKQIATVLEILPKIDPIAVVGSLRQNLTAYLEQVAGGDVVALARYMQCRPTRLRKWIDGTNTVRLGNLVHAATSLDVPVSSFLAATLPSSEDVESAKQAIALVHRPFISLSRQASEISQALSDVLREEVPASLTDIARGLGFKGAWKLYHANPSLYRQIVERRAQKSRPRKRNYDWDLIKEILEQDLQSSAPKGLEQISRALGYADSLTIRKHFPDLCAALRGKIAARYTKLRQGLEDALNRDPPVSLQKVSRSLGFPYQTAQVHEPDLSSKITERYRSYREERKTNLRKAGEAALGEFPPPSFSLFCVRLGVHYRSIQKWFPCMAGQIAERYRLYVEDERRARKEAFIFKVHRIAADLLSQGIYPSLLKIFERLPERPVSDWNYCRETVRETQRMLGAHLLGG